MIAVELLILPQFSFVSDQDEPTYVDALRGVGVRQIACGSGHTVVLTIDGEVYTWGRGDDGRLGHGDNGWKVRTCA